MGNVNLVGIFVNHYHQNENAMQMKKAILFIGLIVFSAFKIQAQNVGVDVALPQQKLDVAGGIRIGSTTNALLGSLRMNGTVLEYHNGTAWVQVSANTDDQTVDLFTLSGNTLSLS
ncbi:MAG: hypothetical protein RL266_1298, partial [Bacteroidota bacterium]